jgi:flagellar hook-associated protein 3 FlgL
MVTRVTTPGNYSAVLANLLAAQQRQMAAGDKVATQRNGKDLKDYARTRRSSPPCASVRRRLGLSGPEQPDRRTSWTPGHGAEPGDRRRRQIRQAIADALAPDRADTLMQDLASSSARRRGHEHPLRRQVPVRRRPDQHQPVTADR